MRSQESLGVVALVTIMFSIVANGANAQIGGRQLGGKLPRLATRPSTRIDYCGMGMLTSGIAALLVVFDKGQENNWFGSHFIVIMAVIAALGLDFLTIGEIARDKRSVCACEIGPA